MARAHAHILTAIWSDPDWTALSANAQRTYLLLLSQPKLNMVGLLDVLPARWARLAGDTTTDTIRQALDDLEAAGFVLVDHNTDELVIRTFVRHEATPAKTANPRWIAGIWRGWDGIASRMLRDAVAAEIPDVVWDSTKVRPPAEAQTTRSAQKLLPETSKETSTRTFCEDVPGDAEAPQDATTDPPSVDNSEGADNPADGVEPRKPRSGQKLPSELSVQNVPHVPLTTNHYLSSSDYSHSAPDSPDDDQKQQPDLEARIGAAVAVLAQQDLTARQQAPDQERIFDVTAWLNRAYDARKQADGPALAELARAHPDLDGEALANLLTPAATSPGQPPARNGTPSPLDSALVAQMTRAEANMRQLRAERVQVETTGRGPQAARQALRSPGPGDPPATDARTNP